MELKVGMYVRGKYYSYRGKIGKIIKNYQNVLEIAYKDGILKTTVSSFIDDNFDINGKQYNASHNIIDLIEVGDYVNGEKVEEIILDNKMSRIKTTECSTYFKEDIYSIVTKEMFSSVECRMETD